MKKSLQLLAILVAHATLAVAALAQAPLVIFISENKPAKSAIENLVVEEYNAQARETLREADLTAWQNYQNVTSYRDVPSEFATTRFNEIKTLLGLADDDPADKGFTDLLEAAGYNVYRSMSTFEEDPFTGAIIEDHEFWPDGDRFDTTGDFFINQAQIDKLNAADLIIMSPDVDAGYYAQGRTNGTNDFSNRDRWNAIEVPIITMDSRLSRSHEWDRGGWGLSYGYDGQYDVVSAYDRRTADPRFEFPDLRPVVVTNDSDFLAGVPLVVGGRVALYMDYASLPELPITNRKFSNNKNYSYPSTSKVILELDFPSFIDASAGEIFTRDPVMIEFQANVPGYQPQDGVPTANKIGTPAATRLYFAAGSGKTGLYNLSTVGETVLLNAVEKYAGPGVIDDGTWYGFPVDEQGWVDTGNPGWFNGFVNVTLDPWIWTDSLDKYTYVPDGSGWVYIPR